MRFTGGQASGHPGSEARSPNVGYEFTSLARAGNSWAHRCRLRSGHRHLADPAAEQHAVMGHAGRDVRLAQRPQRSLERIACCLRDQSGGSVLAIKSRSASPGGADKVLCDRGMRRTNEPQTEAEVERLRESLRRGRPYGREDWMKETAERLGMEASLRPRGRPRKAKTEEVSLFPSADEE